MWDDIKLLCGCYVHVEYMGWVAVFMNYRESFSSDSLLHSKLLIFLGVPFRVRAGFHRSVCFVRYLLEMWKLSSVMCTSANMLWAP